jgi:hypothetical protein
MTISTLADAAANWQQISSGDIVLPRWVVVIGGVLLGITALLTVLSSRTLPALFKVISQIQQGLRDTGIIAARAEAKADTANERAGNVAKGLVNMAQATPAPENAETLRQKAVEHAQAALSPPVTPCPPTSPTPEQP